MIITSQHRGLRHCNGKQGFASPHLAQKIIRRDKRRKGGMNIYRCAACGLFHIGHSNARANNWKYRS
jgi:predicted RNA-binding Zn-ribbon protein involved in translation (DUF1610 family)